MPLADILDVHFGWKTDNFASLHERGAVTVPEWQCFSVVLESRPVRCSCTAITPPRSPPRFFGRLVPTPPHTHKLARWPQVDFEASSEADAEMWVMGLRTLLDFQHHDFRGLQVGRFLWQRASMRTLHAVRPPPPSLASLASSL